MTDQYWLLQVRSVLLLVATFACTTTAFGPRVAFVPLHVHAVSSGSLLSPDPLQPAKSVVSPTTNILGRRRNHSSGSYAGLNHPYNGNGGGRLRRYQGANQNPLLRMANYHMNSDNNGGEYYYNTYGNNYNRGGGPYGPYASGYQNGGYGANYYNDFNGMMNDGYNGEYYGGNNPSHSMQYNSNANMRYNQYDFDRQNYYYYNDWSGNRGNRGVPLMNNRRLGNNNIMNNNNNNNYDAYNGPMMMNNNNGGGGGGGLMRYNHNNHNGDLYDNYYDNYGSGGSFYNNEGKRVRRYDPYSDRSLYNEDALYMQQQAAQAQRSYETNFNRGYNTGGYQYNGNLRRYDPYYDQGAGYYNEDALYDRTGKSLTNPSNRFMLPPAGGGYNSNQGYGRYGGGGGYIDPYYYPERFGWGETGGRPNRGRYTGNNYDEFEYDEAMMDQDYRRGMGYSQRRRRRRPNSSVMGSNVGRGRGPRGDYGGHDDGDRDFDMYEDERRRQRRRVRDRADRRSAERDYYDYHEEDMYDRNPRSSSSSGPSVRRAPRKDPFTRNIEDDAMESMRSGRGRRGEPTTSRREERAYAMSGRSSREGRGGSTVNGSYSRGSTVNGSYYPPPRGEANGGMSIDDLKDML